MLFDEVAPPPGMQSHMLRLILSSLKSCPLVAENDTSNEKGFEPINQLEDIKNLEKISNEETKARQVLSLLF